MKSAESCNITCVLCLVTATILGIAGIVMKQVPACMVTGTVQGLGGKTLQTFWVYQCQLRYVLTDRAGVLEK